MTTLGFGSSSGTNKLKGVMSGGDWDQGGGTSPSSSTMGTIEGPVPRKMITALIVDDDGVNRRTHNLVLRSLGVQSHEVNNGKEAVDLCMGGAEFDLIIMAMEIPVFDGPKVSIDNKLWLQQILPKMKVLQ